MSSHPCAADPSVRAGWRGAADSLALMGVFAHAALRYWLAVFPRTCIELRRWHRRARQIDDPVLRTAALEALGKRGNIEGAAAFAAVMPGRRRGKLVCALVAFQAIYNYVDLLAEQSHSRRALDARRLHAALVVALEPAARHPDYYAFHSHRDDGGYLAEMVGVFRSALSALPSSVVIAQAAASSAARIVDFQALSVGADQALELWVRRQSPIDESLRWWETAAAAGSSLVVHALIAAAAAPSLRGEDVAAIEAAYFPWVSALHSLLDSAVDDAEDAATGQLSLVRCYRCTPEAATRMRWLALQALQAARELPRGRRHIVLVVAMACSYLSAPEVSAPDVLALAEGVRGALGPLAVPALAVFRMRRLARRFAGARGVLAVRDAPAVRLGDRERGADAGAA
jgi:tetraprenyl-beta-curcumene synthase